ncbi:hypothetical protein DUI87_01847 [Hirundo rustica rustica]|uniref:Uncharacterized protein n=1 Tax=Hirundo rustica rustica TaxID=333673 RepID=A0A3M0L5P7_HIRRU|nr:hypothetical protein DUI87_01847 [Hirundo rustica rustica]
MLDGTEARHLGSLSHDPVIDQEMMREAHPCSLWEQVLESVAERYLCADDLYMQQTQWKTIEQGIQRLREMAVVEIVFSDDLNTRNPDLVPCTSVMCQKLVRLGPQEYSSALAIMKRDDREEMVLDMGKKLRAYADAVHCPTHATIAVLETRMQKLENKIEENHKKLREEIKEDILQISAVQNPVELGKYLKERYHDGSKGEKMAAVSWALAYAYRTLLDTVGQQTEAGGKGYKSAATPVTQAAANTPVLKPAAKLEPEPESTAKPDSKPKPLAVAPAKKHTLKTDRPVDNDDPREGPSPKSEAKASSTGSEANIDSFP